MNDTSHRLTATCLVAGAFLLASVAGCGDDDPAQPDAGDPAVDAAADARPDADPGAVPRAEPATCRFEVPEPLGLVEGSGYACGDLITYEDRAEKGRTIRVHYLQIVGAESDAATIYLDGGPGGNGNGILYWLAFADPSFVSGFLAQGDFLVIAQRGTTLSQPSLLCQSGDPASCGEDLSLQADLADFNTGANADDVDDLRAALGYQQLNLYGISYGSRLTLEVLRRHGGNVRAAVAGGTVPAQIMWPAEVPASFHGALQALAASCADHGACGTEFGDLVTVFQNGVTALNSQPAIFDYNGNDVSIYGDTYASLLFQLMYSRSTYPMLPLLISDLGERRTDRVADFLRALFDQYGGGSDLSDGLYYSVVCGELFNPPDEDAFGQANLATPAIIRDTFSYNWYGLLATCAEWPLGTADPSLIQAVTSAVPTLVPNGTIDPITPPRFGDVAADTLSAAQVVVFANSGHGATLQTPCGNQILLDFLSDPTQAPDTSCAQTITTDYTVPAATFAPLLAPPGLRAELALSRLPPGLRAPIERALRKAKAAD